MDRYTKNKMMISEEENQILHNSRVCVVGCGGLGGHAIEMLSRLGVGHITAIDGDVFDITNLNRQILSDVDKIGESKALTAKSRMATVNPEVCIHPVVTFLNESNAMELLKDHDVIVDALDSINIRFLLQETAEKLQIPFVYGAIAGWYGQVSTILPGDRTLNKIYKDTTIKGEEKKLGNPSFTPALASAIQVGEVVKILIKKGELLRNKILFVDLLYQEYEVIDL